MRRKDKILQQHCKWCANVTSGLYLVNLNLFLSCSDILSDFMKHNLIFLHILPFIAADVFNVVTYFQVVENCVW